MKDNPSIKLVSSQSAVFGAKAQQRRPNKPLSKAKMNGKPTELISFHRVELNLILNLYGKMISKGDWKDYALDAGHEKATFSIFRRHGEHPIYRIEKNPKLRKKQGTYAIISATGQILKRGQELGQVLKILERKLEKLSLVR